MNKKFYLLLVAFFSVSFSFAQEANSEEKPVEPPTDSLGVHPWDGQENDQHVVIPEASHWSMYLAAGFNVADMDYTSEKKHGVWLPTVSLGGAYHWNNTWALGLEYKFRNYRVTGSGLDRDADILLKGMSHQADAYITLDVFNMFRPQNKSKLFALDLILGGGALWYKNSIQYPNEYDPDWAARADNDFKFLMRTAQQEPTHMDKYRVTAIFVAGVSAEFNINRSFQLGLRGMYNYSTTDQADARVRPENNDGWFDCEVLLRYKFEPRQKSNVRNFMVPQQIDDWNNGTYYKDPKMGEAKRAKYIITPQKDTIWDITRDTVYMVSPAPVVAAAPAPQAARRGIRDYVVFFENDVPELDQVALSITAEAAMLLQSEPEYNAVVVGSCDNTGAVEYNKWLAVQRATNVKQTLMDMGIDSTRIYFAGRGIMQDDRAEGSYSINRRVEIHIVTDEQMQQAKEDYAYFEQYKSIKKGSAVRQAGEGQHVSSSEALKSAMQKMKETGVIEQIGEAFKRLSSDKTEDANEVKKSEHKADATAGFLKLMRETLKERPAAETPVLEDNDTIVIGPNMTLSQLAKQYYGNAALWPKIFEANRDRLSSPDQLQEGIELIIPKLK